MGDVEFVNRLFESHSVDTIALTCLLLASKFDEIDDNIPLIEEFGKAHTLVRDSLESGYLKTHKNMRPRLTCCRTYPGVRTVQRCELYLLKILCWDLNTVTTLHFVLNHLYQGVVFSNDKCAQDKHIDNKSLEKVKRNVEYFSMMALKQDFMLTKKFEEQTIAAAIIYASRKATKVIETDWNTEAFSQIFGKTLERSEVESCFDILYQTFDATHSAKTAGPFKVEINFT